MSLTETAPPTPKRKRGAQPGHQIKQPPGLHESDVAALIERWRAFAAAYQGDVGERFRRLADQLECIADSGRCTFSGGPVQVIAVAQSRE